MRHHPGDVRAFCQRRRDLAREIMRATYGAADAAYHAGDIIECNRLDARYYLADLHRREWVILERRAESVQLRAMAAREGR